MEKLVNKITQNYCFKERRHRMYDNKNRKARHGRWKKCIMRCEKMQVSFFIHRCIIFAANAVVNFDRRLKEKSSFACRICCRSKRSRDVFLLFFKKRISSSTMKAARNDEETIRVIEAKIIFYSSSKQQFSFKKTAYWIKRKNALFSMR